MSLALLFALVPAAAAGTGSASIVISQVYGGGGNSGAPYRNDFVELFNRGTVAVDLSGWTVQYASAGGNFSNRTVLSGTIQPGQYFLVPESSGGSTGSPLPSADVTGGAINMAAGAGKIALVNNSVTVLSGCSIDYSVVVDYVGYGSTVNCSETTPTGTLSNTTAALRRANGCTDTDSNGADFAVAAPAPRNSSSAFNVCPVGPVPTNPSGNGAASPTAVYPGGNALLTVIVNPGTNPASTGLTVRADLSAIGGSAAQTFFDDGTNGDLNADDNVFSFAATVAPGTGEGAKSFTVTITDAQRRSGSATIALNVILPPPPIPIHVIQGSGPASTYVNQTVSTTGVVTAVRSDGFFLQAPDSEADTDPTTSEGIFVYTGAGKVPANAVPGNYLQVTGKISEYKPSGMTQTVTELGGTVVTQLVRTADRPTPAPLTAGDTPLTGNRETLERLESMLVRVDSLTSTGPSGIAGSATDGKFYAVIDPIARPFREPGIDAALKPADRPDIPVFDGNPELLQVDSTRLTPPLEITSGVTLTNVVGVLDNQSFTIQLLPNPAMTIGSNMSPGAVDTAGNREFTVASFNMLNFGSSNVLPLEQRIAKASLAICNVMGMPDIIGVEEMRDTDTLSALADGINCGTGDSTHAYSAAFIGTSDSNYQQVGLLVKTSRVQVIDTNEFYKDQTFIDPTDGKPKTLFDRAPIVMHATVTPPIGQPFPITVIVNHLKSLIELTTKTSFVGTKRKLEAEYVADLIKGYQDKGEHVITVGDYNAYQFSDGYVDVIGTILGAPTPAAQLYADMYASADLINPDLTDLVNTVPAGQRYSYVEDGNAQAIDHILVTDDLRGRPYRLQYARLDADFPLSFSAVAARPERVSDHDAPVAFFTFPPPLADLSTAISADASVYSGSLYSYTIAVTNHGPDQADKAVVTAQVPANTLFQSMSGPAGWTCGTLDSAGKVSCTTASLAVNSTAQFTMNLAVPCSTADGTTFTGAAAAQSDYGDPDSSNNNASFTSSVSNPAPAMTSVAADKTVLSPPNHKLVDVFLSYRVTDNCGAPYTAVKITSNQPLNGTGDGNTATDWEVVDNNHVRLRAERSPDSKAGRTYTITVTATDSAGGKTSRSVDVSVPR